MIRIQQLFSICQILTFRVLFAAALPWPSMLNPYLALQPRGLLTDTQLRIEQKLPTYFLTRFDRLGWNVAKNGLLQPILLVF